VYSMSTVYIYYYNLIYIIKVHIVIVIYIYTRYSDERNVVNALSEYITVMSFFTFVHNTRLRKCGSRARRREQVYNIVYIETSRALIIYACSVGRDTKSLAAAHENN